MKNKSVKLPFVTKKTTKQSLPVPIVNVRTLSNQNSLVSSKTFRKN